MATAPEERYGACKLCLRSPVPLRLSHLIPQWVYKRVRGHGPNNPNPILVHDGNAYPSSRQFRERMLCHDCEQRFSADELYASQVCYQRNGTVPLLHDLIPLELDDEEGWMVTTATERLQSERLVRFASICLWRCHVSSQAPACSLGEEYGDKLRKFLNDESSFPEDCALTLIVVHDIKPESLPRLTRSFALPM